jgi:hypothetical protein
MTTRVLLQNEISGSDPQGAWRQGEIIDGKPPVVKLLRLLTPWSEWVREGVREWAPAGSLPSRGGVTSSGQTLLSSKWRPHFKTGKNLGKNKNMAMFRRDPRPRMTVLVRIISNLLNWTGYLYRVSLVSLRYRVYRSVLHVMKLYTAITCLIRGREE